jgi:molecular chaperone DnaJ
MSQRDYFEKDYYAVLGVPKDASKADITKAYRKLARELHPDARPDDKAAEERFKEVGEAHSVLSNDDKRKEYDQIRSMVGSGAFGGGFPGGGPGGPGGGFGGAQGINIEDLLGGLFGQRGGSPFGGGPAGPRPGQGRRGRDVETDLTLDFADAMAGVTTTLRVSGQGVCPTCAGTGSAPGTSPVTCQHCQGRGQVLSDQGPFSFAEPCPVCGGRGQRIVTPCETCKGVGATHRTRDVRARIPAGVKDGARIRIPGKGEAGANGGPAGDLFVKIHVNAHPLFGRRGDHLTLTVPITFPEAAMGTRLTVPTLEDGPVTLKVPAGTESGRTFRVRGKGAPGKRGRGDLLVTVEVAVPRKLSRTQRKILEEFAAVDDSDVRAHLREHVGEAEPAEEAGVFSRRATDRR